MAFCASVPARPKPAPVAETPAPLVFDIAGNPDSVLDGNVDSVPSVADGVPSTIDDGQTLPILPSDATKPSMACASSCELNQLARLCGSLADR